MKSSIAVLMTAAAAVEGALVPPSFVTNLNAARQYTWSGSGTGDVMLAWADTLPQGTTSCYDRRVNGAIVSQTGGVVSVSNIVPDLVTSVGDRTNACNGLDTDGIQHLSLAQLSATTNVLVYNGPDDSTTTPSFTVEAPSSQMLSSGGTPTGTSSSLAKKKRRNLMRAEVTSLGSGFVTCWNKERGSQDNVRVFCRISNTDGSPDGTHDHLIHKFPVTTDDEVTSVSVVDMESDGTTLPVNSFALGITFFPPNSGTPQLYVGVYSWDFGTDTLTVVRSLEQITFDPAHGALQRFGLQAIQIAKAHGDNPTSLVAAYATTTSNAVTQVIHTTQPLSLGSSFAFPVAAFGRVVQSTPSAVHTGDNSMLFSFLETDATKTYVRTLHVTESPFPTLLDAHEVGGLTFTGQTHLAKVGTGYMYTAINEAIAGQPVLEVRTVNLLP